MARGHLIPCLLLVASHGLRLNDQNLNAFSKAIHTNDNHRRGQYSHGNTPRIVFGIQTSSLPRYVPQLEAQLATWAKELPRSDLVVVSGPHDDYNDSVVKTPHPSCFSDSNQDCKEGLLLFRGAQRVRALDADWFISIQEDHYVSPDVLRRILQRFSPMDTDVVANFGCGQQWEYHTESRNGTMPKPPGWVNPTYSCDAVWHKGGICNGLGSVYSRAALNILSPQGQTQDEFMNEYMENSVTNMQGRSDLTTSCLLWKRGLRVKPEKFGNAALFSSTDNKAEANVTAQAETFIKHNGFPGSLHVPFEPKDQIPIFFRALHEVKVAQVEAQAKGKLV